jgi:hypothetical protein
MTPQGRRRSLAAAVFGLLCVVTGVRGAAQRVYAYSEPTVCTTFFKPIAGVTFHAGGEFGVTWHINFPQFGPVDYYGQPNPVISIDGKKKWTDPTANVTCFIDWYYLYPTRAMDADFRWHVNEYGGTVSDCSGGTQLVGDPDGPYDPYNQSGSAESCSDAPGGGSAGSTGTCWNEYVYIEESNDGGLTWHVIWEGWATVCG